MEELKKIKHKIGEELEALSARSQASMLSDDKVAQEKYDYAYNKLTEVFEDLGKIIN